MKLLYGTYNHARFIGRALQSVRDQSYPHWEALVVDNQSDDDGRTGAKKVLRHGPYQEAHMSLHHRILACTYPPLRAVKAIGRPLGVASSARLRVLLYHDVAPHEQENFAAQLRWLARRWKFVTPEGFAAMVSGEEVIRGSNLLVTFDDGLASNRAVAEQVLNPMGIRAIFFVVSDFAAIEDRLEARRFISRHYFPDTRPEDLPEHWGNMRWTDLEPNQRTRGR